MRPHSLSLWEREGADKVGGRVRTEVHRPTVLTPPPASRADPFPLEKVVVPDPLAPIRNDWQPHQNEQLAKAKACEAPRMSVIALALFAQAQSGPWNYYKQDVPTQARAPQEGDTATNRKKTGEQIILRDGVWRPVLGPGPHTLIVSDGNTMTRIDYRTGSACQKALNSVQRQVAPPANTKNIIYGPPRISAVCVPR